jgi:hypothetical protein
MGLVAPHIRRWRSLTIKFDQYSPFLWNAALSPCCASGGISSASVQAWNLTELTLLHPRNDDTKEFLLFGGIAPRLARATVAGIHLDWSPGLFANLVYLDYCHHGFTSGWECVAEVLNMLDVSRKLRELRIIFPSATSTMRGGGWDCYPHNLPSSPRRHATPPALDHLRQARYTPGDVDDLWISPHVRPASAETAGWRACEEGVQWSQGFLEILETT